MELLIIPVVVGGLQFDSIGWSDVSTCLLDAHDKWRVSRDWLWPKSSVLS